jgi:mannose-1-phosphate guanylyltransferase
MAGELYAVIMAGGGGTRLWPASRRLRPKQALRLVGERTLFQMAVDRLRGLLPTERILVVTGADQAGLLREQAPDLPDSSFVLEPTPRGTAAVAGLAGLIIEQRSPGAVMACLTADHSIAHPERLVAVLQAARSLAMEGDLVTLGISPTYAATGYGYIERGEPRGDFEGHPAFHVRAFKEKPAAETARAYVADGHHYWNSGMFVWRVDRLREEIARQMPAMEAGLYAVAACLKATVAPSAYADTWSALPAQTIDYGIMEHAAGVSVIPADDLGWCDIGSWDRLFEILALDQDGNLVLGAAKPLLIDTRGTLVFGEEAGRLVVTLGVEDLVVVDTGDVLLVCPRARAEEVRRVVDLLASGGRAEYT